MSSVVITPGSGDELVFLGAEVDLSKDSDGSMLDKLHKRIGIQPCWAIVRSTSTELLKHIGFEPVDEGILPEQVLERLHEYRKSCHEGLVALYRQRKWFGW